MNSYSSNVNALLSGEDILFEAEIPDLSYDIGISKFGDAVVESIGSKSYEGIIAAKSSQKSLEPEKVSSHILLENKELKNQINILKNQNQSLKIALKNSRKMSNLKLKKNQRIKF